jgi:two-component system, response regulator PdtaR
MTLLVARKCLPLGARHSKGVALETSRGPVVLAVEDEPLILMLAVDMIRDAGFEPLWASNADKAIRILESRDDIRIVFTDINMPGSMDGIKLAQAVRGRWPPIMIIATSGFSEGQLKLLPEGSQFIPKPYGAGQISDALHSLAA